MLDSVAIDTAAYYAKQDRFEEEGQTRDELRADRHTHAVQPEPLRIERRRGGGQSGLAEGGQARFGHARILAAGWSQ